jgi:probable addiction module antidote protein
MLKTKKFNIFEELKTEEDIRGFVEASFEDAKDDPDPSLLIYALGIAAKARGLIPKAAKEAGVARESLYRSLSRNGNPSFKTVAKVANSFGYKIIVVPE